MFQYLIPLYGFHFFCIWHIHLVSVAKCLLYSSLMELTCQTQQIPTEWIHLTQQSQIYNRVIHYTVIFTQVTTGDVKMILIYKLFISLYLTLFLYLSLLPIVFLLLLLLWPMFSIIFAKSLSLSFSIYQSIYLSLYRFLRVVLF